MLWVFGLIEDLFYYICGANAAVFLPHPLADGPGTLAVLRNGE